MASRLGASAEREGVKYYDADFELIEKAEPVFVSNEPLNKDSLDAACFQACRGGRRPTHLVFTAKGMQDIVTQGAFPDNYFNPVSALERIVKGYIGSLRGMRMLTDMHFRPDLRFLQHRWAIYVDLDIKFR